MALTSDQIKKVAKLANLPLTSEEEERYGEQLSKILDYIKQLNQVDTQNIDPTFNITGLENVMREDMAEVSLTQDEALKNAADKKDGLFVTKGVFEE